MKPSLPEVLSALIELEDAVTTIQDGFRGGKAGTWDRLSIAKERAIRIIKASGRKTDAELRVKYGKKAASQKQV